MIESKKINYKTDIMFTLIKGHIMSTIFNATIKNNEDGQWYINLEDPIEDINVDCKDINEFEQQIEKLGESYGGRIDEVKWHLDEDVTKDQFEEINSLMLQLQEELNEKENNGTND